MNGGAGRCYNGPGQGAVGNPAGQRPRPAWHRVRLSPARRM